jgi:adenylate cyclase
MSNIRALLSKHPIIVASLLVHVIFGALWWSARAGFLEWAEIGAYDLLLRSSALSMTTAAPIVLVGATEQNLNQYDWPISDGVLAQLLEKIVSANPRAVGVDIYRNGPRPPGHQQLNETLLQHDNIYMVYKFPEQEVEGIPPPEVLRQSNQTGFADVILDPGGVVRRGLLFLNDDQGGSGTSLALQLAARYLFHESVCLQSDGTEANNLMFGPCGGAESNATASDEPATTVLRPFEQNDGSYVGADSRGYQILMDYRGGPTPFPIVEFADVLDGKVDTDIFADRVVIVGVTAQSVKDFFFTPFSVGVTSDQAIYGIEIHAHLASQFIRHGIEGQPPITSLLDWQESVWLWVWCILGAIVGYMMRSPWRFMVAAAVGAALAGAIAYVFFLNAVWIPVVPPIAAWIASAAVITSYVSQLERSQRGVLMNLFSRHVSSEVAEQLWKQREAFMDGGKPRPQRVTATVLFTDLKGFTTISETMDPAQLMDWLNRYMEAMSVVISEHGGVIDKFIGDAIMAVFGVPNRRETDAEIGADARSAVNCALSMKAVVNDLNKKWQRDKQPTIGMRVGIHTGELVAGGLGSSDRLDYTVIGDTVNTAARLESYDKNLVDPVNPDAATRILIGQPTYEHLDNSYDTALVGSVSLKGKEQDVKIYLVRPQEQRTSPTTLGEN